MKCHEYCQALFDSHFLPMLKEQFPEILPHLSVGIVGGGSQVLGADDELSRDHSWGPDSGKFILPPSYVEQLSENLSHALAAVVPNEFLGIETSQLRSDTIQVTTLDSIYAEQIGPIHPPSTYQEWADVESNDLCFASSGFVIYDPSNALQDRISEFNKAYYPTDIWKWRIASHLWKIWHFGTYNSCDRLAKRGDGIGLLVGQGRFVEETMRLICLLNKKFPVYWKWLHWQFQGLPRWTDMISPHLRELEAAANVESRSQVMRKTCQVLRTILYEDGLLPTDEWRNFMGSKEVARQIESEEVRQLIQQREGQLANW